MEFGGTAEHTILVVVLRCIADSLALLVTDSKGRIAFATSQLGALLGYPPRALADGMNMSALLPPPLTQLHSTWMKDLSGKPPPNSCRAGAVVQLLHANGSRVPAVLHLSTHDDGDKTQHVIKVVPASAAQAADHQRLELSLNHRGVVLAVNAGASKALFGLQPSELVGLRLSAFVNLFGAWRARFGEEDSLLASLALRCEQGQDVVLRCGLHNPFSEAEIAQHYASGSGAPRGAAMAATASSAGLSGLAASTTASAAGGGGLLGALKSRFEERPAVMTLTLLHDADGGGGGLDAASADAEGVPLLKLCLWRADALSGQLELDGKLGITRADASVGLMFGVSGGALLHKSYKK